MKRVLVMMVALFAICSSASAQTLGEFVKGTITNLVDQATDGKATEFLMTDSWTYSAPAVRLESDDELANLAGNALISLVDNKLASAYKLVGIKEGNFSLTLNTDNTFTMVLGKRTHTGTYTYDATTHALDLHFTTKLIKLKSLSGYAYLNGDSLDVAFDCTRLANFLTALGSKVSALSSVTQMVKNYDSVLLGFTFSRQ